jgi:hypothetical protein
MSQHYSLLALLVYIGNTRTTTNTTTATTTNTNTIAATAVIKEVNLICFYFGRNTLPKCKLNSHMQPKAYDLLPRL